MRGAEHVTYVKRSALVLQPDELEAFLRENRWGRLATASLDGSPHVTPLGYVYHDGAIWFHALRRGLRGRQLAENPQAAFLVDDGLGADDAYTQRRGAILYGPCEAATRSAAFDEARVAYAQAMGAATVDEIQRPRTHAWYRLEISHSSSWDFRKIPVGADRKAS